MRKVWVWLCGPWVSYGQALEIRQATTTPAAQGSNVALVLEVANPSSQPVTMMGLKTEAAGLALLRHHARQGGLNVVTTLPEVIIPARSVVKLLPAATEVYLVKLQQSLRAGEEFPLLLNFAPSATQTVRVQVRPDTPLGY